MKKNITFFVDESLLYQAQHRASLEKTNLDTLFEMWLTRYIAQTNPVEQYHNLMTQLNYIQVSTNNNDNS